MTEHELRADDENQVSQLSSGPVGRDAVAISGIRPDRAGHQGVLGAVPLGGSCPIESAMGLVGSRPAMLIMREAFYGTSRFDDFVQRVEVATATASTHLRALTKAGLLERRPYREPGGRTRDEYALTEAGAELMPVLFGLFEWGRRHTGVRPLLDFAHAGCGHPVEVRVRCAAGHELGPEDIELRWAATPGEPGDTEPSS